MLHWHVTAARAASRPTTQGDISRCWSVCEGSSALNAPVTVGWDLICAMLMAYGAVACSAAVLSLHGGSLRTAPIETCRNLQSL
jgi:hypothetical protein